MLSNALPSVGATISQHKTAAMSRIAMVFDWVAIFILRWSISQLGCWISSRDRRSWSQLNARCGGNYVAQLFLYLQHLSLDVGILMTGLVVRLVCLYASLSTYSSNYWQLETLVPWSTISCWRVGYLLNVLRSSNGIMNGCINPWARRLQRVDHQDAISMWPIQLPCGWVQWIRLDVASGFKKLQIGVPQTFS